MRALALLTVIAGLASLATPLRAQDAAPKLAGLCEAPGGPVDPALRDLCRDAAAAVEVFQPEAGILMVGGNPVLGTASPVGTRFRFIPRINLSARLNLVFVHLPDVLDYGIGGTAPVGKLGFAVPMPGLEASVGVFDGFSLLPSVSGLGAVELLGSTGFLLLPGGEGFQQNATAFGLGARIGLLRESFLAPGLSVSALYKWMDRVQFGDLAAGDDAEFGADLRVLSFRAGISKQFLILGIAAGLGWDRYRSDVDLRIASPVEPAGGPGIVIASQDAPAKLQTERWSGFVDVSYVLLFVNFVAEAGWQGTDRILLTNGDELKPGNFFGALGVRLSL